MDIAAIDRSAVGDLGWLHRVSPTAKLAALVLALAAVVVTWNPFVAAALLVSLAAVVISAGIDTRLAFVLAAYPSLFALIFALASAPDPLTGTTIVLKAVSAALVAVTVVLTTPYPQVFAPIQRIVPPVVGDALLMTYRTMFVLLGKLGQLVRVVRLRAGIRGVHPVRAARATTTALGSLLIYGIDLAQRDYDILQLRGYSGRLRIPLPRSRSRAADAALLIAAAGLLATSVVWRMAWRPLNPYSWLVPVPALAALCVVTAARIWKRKAER